jgi:hypothetical protein
VHDAERVAAFDHANDRPDELRSGALGVVALGDDAVEELTAGTELHDEVHEEGVLVGAADADDVGVLGEVVHDLDLAPHVLVVVPAQKLALGDGLARVLGAVGLAHALVRGAELPLPQLLTDAVVVAHISRLVRQHRRRPTPRPHRHWGWQSHVRIGTAGLLPARALRVRLHCLRPRWSLPGSRTVRTPLPSLGKKPVRHRFSRTADRKMETGAILSREINTDWDQTTRRLDLGARDSRLWGFLGEWSTIWARQRSFWRGLWRRADRRNDSRGRRRCEAMGLLCFSLPFQIDDSQGDFNEIDDSQGDFNGEVTCRGWMFPPRGCGNRLGNIDDSSEGLGLGPQMGTDWACGASMSVAISPSPPLARGRRQRCRKNPFPFPFVSFFLFPHFLSHTHGYFWYL